MLKGLLSAVSVCVLLSATLFFPGPISARRCGYEEPATLLSHYRSCQFIYVAKFDKLEKDATSEGTFQIKKHYSISSSLKGESRKMVVLEETEIRSGPDEPPTVGNEAEVAGEM